MKVPPKRKGNTLSIEIIEVAVDPSMKVPPKRKGNSFSRMSNKPLATIPQ